MAKIYSELERAQFQNNAGNLSTPESGLMFLDTALTPDQVKYYADAAWHVFMDLDSAQTATSKTFTSPTINAGALSGTFTGTPTFSGDITFSSTGAIQVPVGTTGEQPAGANGKIRYNTDTNSYEGYAETAWKGLGGGGGGGSLIWNEVPGQAPTRAFLAGERVYEYQEGLTQKLTAWIRVPDSFGGGSQIKVKIGFAVNSAGTDDVRMLTTTTLIEPGDAVTSTTDQYTPTPVDTTLSGTANALNNLEIELTNASGLINSNAVAAGDVLLVELYRQAPAGTEDTTDIQFVPSMTEVLFS